ncbi:serine hydrolase domain-containing protein [Saccharothrix stipae]
MAPTVEGTVASGYERVAEAFERALAEDRSEIAQCCVHVDGEPVVDLWTGPRDAVVAVFSATKGATAACANLLVQRGLLDLDAPVTRYWPEYGANGKEGTLVRWVLSHRAGVLAPSVPFTLDGLADWEAVTAALAASAPVWAPGTAYGYHAQSYGWLVGELVRRVDGRGLGAFFREEIANPAGADFWIGLPEVHEPRVATLVTEVPGMPSEVPAGMELSEVDLSAFVGPHQITAFTFGGALPEDAVAAAADRRYRALGLGASGGVADARGLSRVYRWLLDAFTASTLADLPRPETGGDDLVLSSPAMPIEQVFGRGFEVSPPVGAAVGARTFGHGGAGGTTGFADVDRRLAFGYTTNRLVLGPPGSDVRAGALVEAVYRANGVG